MFVGQEQLVVSKKVGEQFKKMGVKKVACLNQEVGNVALDERAKGLADGFRPECGSGGRAAGFHGLPQMQSPATCRNTRTSTAL
jgi:hypothetical protein